jgi:hypothetical protein
MNSTMEPTSNPNRESNFELLSRPSVKFVLLSFGFSTLVALQQVLAQMTGGISQRDASLSGLIVLFAVANFLLQPIFAFVALFAGYPTRPYPHSLRRLTIGFSFLSLFPILVFFFLELLREIFS